MVKQRAHWDDYDTLEYVWHAFVGGRRYPVAFKDHIVPGTVHPQRKIKAIYAEPIEETYRPWTKDYVASLREAEGILIIDDRWRVVSFNRIRVVRSKSHIKFEMLESLGAVYPVVFDKTGSTRSRSNFAKKRR